MTVCQRAELTAKCGGAILRRPPLMVLGTPSCRYESRFTPALGAQAPRIAIPSLSGWVMPTEAVVLEEVRDAQSRHCTGAVKSFRECQPLIKSC